MSVASSSSSSGMRTSDELIAPPTDLSEYWLKARPELWCVGRDIQEETFLEQQS
jgi:hypothetical protein